MESSTIKPVPKPRPMSQGDRKTELTQLERRYRTSFRTISDTDSETVIRLAIKPSDPDFPFELDVLQLQLIVPQSYPKTPCSIMVLNSDIPKGFAFNLEQGFRQHAQQTIGQSTLVRLMSWLDKNMETLLQQAPAATVKFVAQQPRHENAVAPSPPAQSATAAQGTVKTIEKSTETKAPATQSLAPPLRVRPSKLDAKAAPYYTPAQLIEAREKRKKQLHQLQSRFPNSYKILQSDHQETVVQLSATISSPGFRYNNVFGGEMRLKYHIPEKYPLEPCTIELDNRGLEKRRAKYIADVFAQHVAGANHTLFQNLNWLHLNLETLMDNVIKEPSPPQSPASTPATTQTPVTSSQSEASRSTKPSRRLFDMDDDIKSRVIIVNDPGLLRPPGVQEEPPAVTQESEESSSDTEDDNDSDTTEEDDTPQAESSTSAGPPVVIRNGTEVRLISPHLENISLFRCTSLHLLVKCGKCKEMVDIENVIPKDPLASHQANSTGEKRWTVCGKCSNEIGVNMIGELVHQNASTLGLLQVVGCVPFDILPSSFIGTCASCMDDMRKPFHIAPHDQVATTTCFTCHTRLAVRLGDYRFVTLGEQNRVTPADEAHRAKAVMKRKKKVRDMRLVVGEPLPNQGRCDHYKRSKRWFRFPCCNKLYPCDVCHDKKEDHGYELARRHVCGLCSREQTIVSGRPCQCGQEFDRQQHKGAFWEGGQGVRNQATMSRKDPHKYRGAGKTLSKKHERVGAAGKENRPSKDSE